MLSKTGGIEERVPCGLSSRQSVRRHARALAPSDHLWSVMCGFANHARKPEHEGHDIWLSEAERSTRSAGSCERRYSSTRPIEAIPRSHGTTSAPPHGTITRGCRVPYSLQVASMGPSGEHASHATSASMHCPEERRRAFEP